MTDALRLCDVRAMLCSSIVARSEGCRITHSGFCIGIEPARVDEDMTRRDVMLMECDVEMTRCNET